MSRGRAAMLLCLGLAAAGLCGVGAVAEPAGTPERLAWQHRDLDLFLDDVEELDGRLRFRFVLKLKPHAERGAVWVGHPRYRSGSDLWRQAVVQGVSGRDRSLVASAERSGRAGFSIVVPRDAIELSVPLDRREVRVNTRGSIGWSTERVRSAPIPTRSPGQPVRLTATLRWPGEKPFGDGALDAGERGELLLDVQNEGARVATGSVVRVTAQAAAAGLNLPDEIPLPDLEPGERTTVTIPIDAGSELADGTARLSLRVVEPFGHDAAPIDLSFTTRAIDLPELLLTEDFAVEGAGVPAPRDRIVALHLRVRNVGRGAAEDVVAEIAPGENVFTAHDSAHRFALGRLEPGEVAELTYRCYANQRAGQLLLNVDLIDARTRSSSVLTLPLEGAFDDVPRIVSVSPDPRVVTPLAPLPPPLTSDVDRHVPLTPRARPDAIAVVLGVERYAASPPATHAAADARTAARYFEHALGIPAERIELLLDDDVTLARMHRLFDTDGWLARRVEEGSEVFVYFAGHGVAESEAFDPYLLPHDGDLGYVRQTGLSLDALVERLALLDAGHVTLFLDACFSGLSREGASLVRGARKLVVVPVHRTPSGVSIFSAARGSQTAHALDEQGHGLFSYFLFRGLGGAADLDRDRFVTAGELKLYLDDEVPRAALLADVDQTPAIFPDDVTHVLVRLP